MRTLIKTMKLTKQIIMILFVFCCTSCFFYAPPGKQWLEPPEPSEIVGIWEGFIYKLPFLVYCRVDIREDGTGILASVLLGEKEDVDILRILSWNIMESNTESNLVFRFENLDDDNDRTIVEGYIIFDTMHLFDPDDDSEEPVIVLWRESDLREMSQILKDEIDAFEKEEHNNINE